MDVTLIERHHASERHLAALEKVEECRHFESSDANPEPDGDMREEAVADFRGRAISGVFMSICMIVGATLSAVWNHYVG